MTAVVLVLGETTKAQAPSIELTWIGARNLSLPKERDTLISLGNNTYLAVDMKDRQVSSGKE